MNLLSSIEYKIQQAFRLIIRANAERQRNDNDNRRDGKQDEGIITTGRACELHVGMKNKLKLSKNKNATLFFILMRINSDNLVEFKSRIQLFVDKFSTNYQNLYNQIHFN